MGFNTTVVVLNDALDQIRDDPEFGKKLYDAVLKSGAFYPEKRPIFVRAGNHVNAATVVETHHADGLMIVAVGANGGRVVGSTHWERLRVDGDEEFREQIIRDLARDVRDLVVSKRRRKPRKESGK